MGILLPSYKKALLDEMLLNISSNNSSYYAFASNPRIGNTSYEAVDTTDYDTMFESNWTMLFGKKLTNNDIVPVISRIDWEANTVYTRYDNTSNTISNSSFYVLTLPVIQGGFYHVYKCIDNANGGASTERPDQQQLATFTKSDGYTWKYMYSISNPNYSKFATNDYIPIIANTSVENDADQYTGLDNIVISNNGVGYDSYNSGTVLAVINSTMIQIESTASGDNNFYTRNGIYLKNMASSTSQLKVVSEYISNLSGNWIRFDSAANTNNITPGITEYIISPRIIFDVDSAEPPAAYSVVNTSSNNIGGVVIIDRGNDISRATATVQSNSVYGYGANLYCIVPPPGGHGSDPASELYMKGFSVSLTFANNEGNTISTNCSFNRIGIMKNPWELTANNEKGTLFTSNSFSQLFTASVTTLPSAFATGSSVIGNTSGARGIVVASNTTYIEMVGDKNFANGEIVYSADDELNYGTLTINSRGAIYTKDLVPLYVNGINNVERTAEQTEVFKLIIQV